MGGAGGGGPGPQGEAFTRTCCGTDPGLWARKTSLEILPDVAEHLLGSAM